MPPQIDRSRVLAGIDSAPGGIASLLSRLRTRLESLNLYVEGTRRGERLEAVHHTRRHLWLRDRQGRPISPSRLAQLAGSDDVGVRWMALAERWGRNLAAPLQDAVVVAPRPAANRERLARQLETHGLREWPEKSRLLGSWQYFVVEPPGLTPIAKLAAALQQRYATAIERVHIDYLTHAPALLFDPNDIYYDRQWAPARIGAPAAWDVARGAGVIVAVIDSGCALDHPDLRFHSRGINLEDMTLDASPVGATERERAHGTSTAGVIGATLNNITGVAGIAGECRILPFACDTFTHSAVAMGIRAAVMEGARVVNMSFETFDFGFASSPLVEAIEEAAAADVVLCASSGNGNYPRVIVPARHPDVIACGGSDEADRRWVSSATLGSNYGDDTDFGQPVGVSVVAPALNILTTDIPGPTGSAPGASPWADYTYYHATSAAAPHVAGLAALLISRDPAISAGAVRRLIERTAEKVGGVPYADVAGYPSGARHPEMGYGRISAARAIDLGDTMIADWPDDDGDEPSTPPRGVFWTTSDIVIRPADDGVFAPTDPDASSVLVRGVDHTISVRVRNLGPTDARNVRVDVRVAPWAGTEFAYPIDWTATDMLHLRPTPVEAEFPVLTAGGPPHIARFTLPASQVDVAAGWTDRRWHPCLLGVVTADNDYAFASAAGVGLQMPRNNLAQRNLTVGVRERLSLEWPFVIGHPSRRERIVDLVIEAGALGSGRRVDLVLDDDGRAFPMLMQAQGYASGALKVVQVAGGTPPKQARITMTSARMVLRLALPRPGRYPLRLSVRRPARRGGARWTIDVQQRTPRGDVVGGASVVV